MIRVNPFHWTADFRLARGLAEAYHSSGFSDVCFFCIGDPDDVIGQLGTLVADETIKYYPNVLGTSERPVTPETFDERVEELLEKWSDAFVIGIEAGFGPANLLGSIEITDRDLTTIVAPERPSQRYHGQRRVAYRRDGLSAAAGPSRAAQTGCRRARSSGQGGRLGRSGRRLAVRPGEV